MFKKNMFVIGDAGNVFPEPPNIAAYEWLNSNNFSQRYLFHEDHGSQSHQILSLSSYGVI